MIELLLGIVFHPAMLIVIWLVILLVLLTKLAFKKPY